MRTEGARLRRPDQPDARDPAHERGSAQQARGGAPGLPGDRLRAALPRRRRARRDLPRHARASTPRRAPTITRACSAYLEHVYANDLTLGIAMTDAKGDRSLRPAQQPEPRHLRAHRRAARRRHRDLRHQGDRHRGAVRARAPRDARPQHDRGRTAISRCAARCRSTPTGLTIVARPAGRPGEAAASFSRQVRPVDRRVPLRPRVRAVGARVLRRRMAARRRDPLQLHDAASPHLHRARAPASATC